MPIKWNYCRFFSGFAVAAFLLLGTSAAAQALPPDNQASLSAQPTLGATTTQNGTLVIGSELGHSPFATGVLFAVFLLAIAGYFLYQMHAERKESARKYRDLYDHAPDMFLSVDSHNEIILECNQTLLDSTGYSREELVGHSAFALYHPDCADRVRAMHQRFLSSKEVHEIELLLRRKDGSKIDVSLSASAVCDAKGNLLHSRTVLHDISAPKQLELSLRDSEIRFRAIIEASPIPYALNDDQFNITYLNTAFTHTFGYTLADIPTVADWWPRAYPDPAYRQKMVAAWQSNMQKAEREQAPFEPLEANIQCSNGDVRSVLVAASPLCMSRHDLHVVTFYDITERKQAEEALRKSEESFRNFFEINTSVMLLIDPASGNIMAANAAAISFYGYPAEQIVGMSISEINAMTPERIAEEGQRSLREECNFFHFSHRLASGEVRDVEVHLTPIDSGGRPMLFSIIHDITERMQAEVKLRLAATVFTHAREGIMITRADGTIIDVNDTFSHITGYSRDEVLGRNPRLLGSGRHQKEFFAALWKSLIKDGHWYGEIWNRRKNGEVFAEMLTISAVSDALGNAQQYVALFSDITPLKEHEKQLEHIAHYDALTALPNRVLLADRMRQAMIQALRRAQRMAVIYIDIDGFKTVNDSHGHETGDQLLVAIAKRMKQALREGDTLARLGGDEFVAVLPDLEDRTDSEPMLNRLLAAAAQPVFVGELVLNISISLGITFYPQAEETDSDQLLRQADQSMYQAKLAGKNCYRYFQA